MARTGSLDPLTRYRYTVHFKIDGDKNFIKKTAFESVTAPRLDFQIEEYREGGRHLNPHQITTGVQFSPVTLRRGKTFTADFYNWVSLVFRAFYGDDLGNTSNYRGTVVIDHFDRAGKVIKKYILVGARPQSYIPASNFNASDDSEVSIESMTITYEGYAEFSVNYSNLTGVIGQAGAGLVNAISGGSNNLTLKEGIDASLDEAIGNIYNLRPSK